MKRWCVLAVVAVFVPFVGCKWLGLDRDKANALIKNDAISTPKVSEADVEQARRVNDIGKLLVEGTPFLGIEPSFQTVSGNKAPELFHRDSTGVFLTDGLVKLCPKDEQLAGVLAYELGQMIAESRRAERMKLRDPIPNVALGGKPDGSSDYNPGRDLYLAQLEKEGKKPGPQSSQPKKWQTTDAAQISRQLLAGAGFPEKALDDVQPILAKTNRVQDIAKQLGGKSAAPKWNE